MSIVETIAAFTIALLLRDAIRSIGMGISMALKDYEPEKPFLSRVLKYAGMCL